MKKKEIKNKYNQALETIKRQEVLINSLERQIEICEKAIIRKDKQFLGLRTAFQDEIINKL